MSENKDIEQIAELLFGLRKYSQEELCCAMKLMDIFGKADSDEQTKMLVRAAALGYKLRHTELIPPTTINSHNTINGNNNIIGNGNNITDRPSNQEDLTK